MSAGVGVGRRSVSIRSCASEVRKKEKGRPSVDWPAGWPSKNKSVCPRAMRLLCSACMRAPGRRHAAPAEGPAAACTSPAPPAARTGSPHACPSRPWPPIQAVTPSVRPALRHAGRRRARANGTEKWLRAGVGGARRAHARARGVTRRPSALRPPPAAGRGPRRARHPGGDHRARPAAVQVYPSRTVITSEALQDTDQDAIFFFYAQ